MTGIVLSDGSTLQADHYVFACGPWTGALFPEIVGPKIRVTCQEVFFFGTPAGDARFHEDRQPVWIELGPRLFYGVPGNGNRGMKVADDTRGPVFDPTWGERRITQARLKAARKALEKRFSSMKDAPLVESRVCQYENTPDGRFILDRMPGIENVWIAAGGSGHGFKHGPVVGETMAGMILNAADPDPHLSFSRFDSPVPKATTRRRQAL